MPRRILLAVTGLSPQIVTETIYALAVKPVSGTPWLPTEVHVVTTQRGKETLRLALLADQSGWFHRLRTEYRLPPIRFDESLIHVLEGADGRPLDDIRNDDDNRAAADGIARVVRTLTEDVNSELHASIAGGRKTMGFFLGYAMSLFGRTQDRLSHVLISEPYEANREFYYPTKTSYPIPRKTDGSEMVDARDAQVWLGDIPFVRLRASLPKDSVTAAKIAFSDVVSGIQENVTPSLTVDKAAQTVTAYGKSVRLRKAELAFLLLAIERTKAGESLARHKAECKQSRIDADAYIKIYAVLGFDPDDRSQTLVKAMKNELLKDFFDQRKTKVGKAFKSILDKTQFEKVMIRNIGKKSHSQYVVPLPAESLVVR